MPIPPPVTSAVLPTRRLICLPPLRCSFSRVLVASLSTPSAPEVSSRTRSVVGVRLLQRGQLRALGAPVGAAGGAPQPPAHPGDHVPAQPGYVVAPSLRAVAQFRSQRPGPVLVIGTQAALTALGLDPDDQHWIQAER